MSIFSLDLSTYKQNFEIYRPENIQKYGEVHTNFDLINKMFDLVPEKYFKNPKLKWLDPCTGRGYFAMVLYKKLFYHLSPLFPNSLDRHDHIVKNMIWMVEINMQFIPNLMVLFGDGSNIISEDFLEFKDLPKKFDFVIGNPPYSSEKFKSQCNYTSVWHSFIKKSFELLKNNGHLLFITPSIWMKNTHAAFPSLMLHKFKKIHNLTNVATNKVFNGMAQVPSCYFLAMKTTNTKYSKNKIIELYDSAVGKYIKYNIAGNENFPPTNYFSLPLCASSIINKMQKYILKFGHIRVTKISIRTKRVRGLKISEKKTKEFPYTNIATCHMTKEKPYLVFNYSNIKCPHQDTPKIVLAHKMYGYPYYDKEGKYGMSGRDTYVILKKTHEEFMRLQNFLSSNLFLTLTEASRYRQSFLDKHIFTFLPDIIKIPNFPKNITNETIAKFFKFSDKERKLINSHKKKHMINKF